MWASMATLCAISRCSSWRSRRSKGDSPAHDRASPHGSVTTVYGGHARRHCDRAFALYDPAEHRPLATRFFVDSRVAILSFRSWIPRPRSETVTTRSRMRERWIKPPLANQDRCCDTEMFGSKHVSSLGIHFWGAPAPTISLSPGRSAAVALSPIQRHEAAIPFGFASEMLDESVNQKPNLAET